MPDSLGEDSVASTGGSRRGWWVAAVLAVTTIVLAALLGVSLQNGWSLMPKSTPGEVTITGIDRYIQYVGNTTGSIGPTINDSCPSCPLTIVAGSWIQLPVMIVSVQSEVPEIFLWSWLNGSISHEYNQGQFYGLPDSDTYAPLYAIIDPPLNATSAENGALTLSIIVTPCSETTSAWNYCYPS